MSILIKGMEMPKDCGACPFAVNGFPSEWRIICTMLERGVVHFEEETNRPADCPIIEVPPHGRLIDADALYEQTAEWEATALAQVERHMNDEDLTEWRKWSVILQERSAFKHDIADAPTIIEREG